jgi:hypothetical protein
MKIINMPESMQRDKTFIFTSLSKLLKVNPGRSADFVIIASQVTKRQEIVHASGIIGGH